MESTGIEDSHIFLLAPLLLTFKDLDVLILDHNLPSPARRPLSSKHRVSLHDRAMSHQNS